MKINVRYTATVTRFKGFNGASKLKLHSVIWRRITRLVEV